MARIQESVLGLAPDFLIHQYSHLIDSAPAREAGKINIYLYRCVKDLIHKNSTYLSSHSLSHSPLFLQVLCVIVNWEMGWE